MRTRAVPSTPEYKPSNGTGLLRRTKEVRGRRLYGRTLRAIRAVANGEAIFGLKHRRARHALLYRAERQASTPPTFPQFTDREYEILTLIAQRRDRSEARPQPKNRA
jgi:hypothetical protein